MLAGAALAYLRRYGVAPGAAPCSSSTTTAPTRRRSPCRPLDRARDRGRSRGRRARQPAGLDIRACLRVAGFDGRRVEVRGRGDQRQGRERSRPTSSASPAAVVRPSISRASPAPRWPERRACAPDPRRTRCRRASAGAARGLFGLGAARRDGLSAGCGAARLAGFPTAAPMSTSARGPPVRPRSNRCGRSPHAARASSTCRTTSRRMTSAWRIAKATATSST